MMRLATKEQEMQDLLEEEISNRSYRLSSTNNETFTNRVDSIFGCLDSLEQKHTEAITNFETINEDDNAEEPSGSNDYDEEKQSKIKKIGENGGQKRNYKKRSTPDFVSNPGKWKKYSLKEDGTSRFTELSADQLNTKVATDFMDTLKERKDSDMDISGVDHPFVFKVPDLPNKHSTTGSKPVFGLSHGAKARCMETFEFGQNNKNKKQVAHEVSSSINCGSSGSSSGSGSSSSSSSSSSNTSSGNSRGSSNLPKQKINLEYEHPENIDNNDKTDGDNCSNNTSKNNNDEGGTHGETFKSREKKKNRAIRKRVYHDED